MHLTYVALHQVTWCMVVSCTQNVPRRQQFYVAQTTSALTPATTPRLGLCHTPLTPARTPMLGLCHSTLTPATTPRLGLCHNTLTPAKHQGFGCVGTQPSLGVFARDTLSLAKIPRLWLSQHTDTSTKTKAWAVSHHTDTIKHTNA